jgi:lysozyme
MRATWGISVDGRFTRNWAEAKKQGIPRGAYHFLKPDKNWKAQLELFASITKGAELPPVLDVEESGLLSKNQLNNVIPKCLNLMEELTGKRPIIYTSAGFWNRYMPSTDLGNLPRGNNPGYMLWVANYWPAWYPRPTLPKDWAKAGYTFWQWSKSGRLAGAPGCVDLNRYNGTRAQFEKMVKND